MTGKGKITITEIFLLLGAALFLVLMLVMHLWNTRDAARGSYDVKTQKITGEEFVIDKVDKETAEMSRALNNLKDLFFIVKDGNDFQIMYDPDRKC